MPDRSVFASGLDNPRGLAFGPDGALYVAGGGRGGSTSSEGRCKQVQAPVGPYTGGMTGRVSRIGADGTRTTVADGLPSSQSTPVSGALVTGVAGVAFVGETLYALVAGAGCSHGLEGTSNGIYRIGADGSATLLADLGAYLREHPTAAMDPNDDEYDGTWFSMTATGDGLVAVEPNRGCLERIGLDGSVTRIADISASQGHVVPTAVTTGPDGELDPALYVANLGRFPISPGSSKVLRIGREGEVTEWATGLTAVLGLAFGPDGSLYAVETSVPREPAMPRPDTGRVVRIELEGRPDVVEGGLDRPTALAFGPDGLLYVSVAGFAGAGRGRIERLDLGL